MGKATTNPNSRYAKRDYPFASLVFGLYPQSLSGKVLHLFRVHGKSALKGCPGVNHLQSSDRTLERFGFIDKSSVFDTRSMNGKG
jgi:hypothetical protein